MAAIAMVLVAAIALGSSTYAWFASNTKVTATEMKVQAVAENGIEIKAATANDADYASSDASAETSVMVLYPTSTYDGTTWAHATAGSAGSSAAKAGTYEMLTTKLAIGDKDKTAAGYSSADTKQLESQKYDEAGKQYYRVDKFNIRTVQGTTVAQKVGVSKVTVTGTPAALDKSLRILVVGDDGKAIYNAGAGDTTRVVCASVNNSNNPETVASVTYLANTDKSGLIATCEEGTATAAGAAKTVSIYLYYEGEETAHYSNNLENALAELTVTVEFESDDNLSATDAITPKAASDNQKAGTAVLNPTN